MGCDMHAHVEIKINGQWHHYAHPRVHRFYEVFTRLAGVRGVGKEKPIAANRGVPANATYTTKFDYDIHWGSDAHSASWISDKECIVLEKWFSEYAKENGLKESDVWRDVFDRFYMFGNDITTPINHPEEYKRFFDAGYEEARIVFWFDN